MENLWKTYGKTIENLWKTYGNPMVNLSQMLHGAGRSTKLVHEYGVLDKYASTMVRIWVLYP